MSIFDQLKSILPTGKDKDSEKEFHLALELSPSFVKASLWTVENQVVHIWGIGSKEFPVEDWDKALEAADEAIAISCEKVNAEISKVMFGLPESWVEEDRIKEPYFTSVKKISKELELEPLAFVAIPEAISYFLKQQESSPLTAILVGIDRDDVNVTLVRVGKISGTKLVKRSGESLGFDVEKVLSLFENVEVFPPRILLYGEGDLSKVQSELLSHPWVKNSLFIHFPKVEILFSNIDISSVVLAGGLDLAKRQGLEIFGVPVVSLDSKPRDSFIQEVEEGAIEEEPEQEGEKEIPVVEVKKEMEEFVPSVSIAEPLETVENLGFVKGKDFAELHNISAKIQSQEEEILEEVGLGKQGLPENKIFPGEDKISSISEKLEREAGLISKEVAGEEEKVRVTLGQKLGGIFSKFPRFSFPHVKSSRNGLTFAAIAVFIILFLGAGGVWAYWNLPKATIKLYVEPKPKEGDLEMTVNPLIGQMNADTKEIPGRVATVTSKGAKKGVATGRKMVGDKARGEVTIYNKTVQAKTFPSGTILIGSNSLKFTLDDEVKVASASEELGITVHGKTKTNVSAFEIGTESNVAAGNDFTFKDFSNSLYYGRNEQAFSGGSSRQVMVVSEVDQRRLESTLSAELTEKGKSDLQSQISQEERLADKAVKTQVISKKFDKKVDEEGNEINLSMEVMSKTAVFSDSTVKEFIKNISKGLVPEGYEFKESEVSYTTEFVKQGVGDSVLLKVRYKVNLVPLLDIEKMKRDLVGKKEAVVEDYLNRQPQLAGFGIKFIPKLPKFLRTLPYKTKNITIEVAPR